MPKAKEDNNRTVRSKQARRKNLGLPPGFSFWEAFGVYNNFMDKKPKQLSKIFEGLNQQQIQAVTHPNGPFLIIAGAGTGKTTVITRRIVWLMENNFAKPEEILALTFTEKAADEMLVRVEQMMPIGFGSITISTFHSFAQRILLDHALDIGLPGDFKVLDNVRAWVLLKENIEKFDLDYYRPLGNPDKFLRHLINHFIKAKEEGITPDIYLKFTQELVLNQDSASMTPILKKKEVGDDTQTKDDIKRVTEIANAFSVYQRLLLENGYLDFSDLIQYSILLLKKRPAILQKYKNKYKYILIDEFQDTDLSQYEFIKLISSPKNNITVVGDDDQSIYKFRGASISNILKFKEDYPQAKDITLTINYRSSQNILDLAYSFIKQNDPERLESKLKISKKLVSEKTEKGLVDVLHTKNSSDEAETVCTKIQEMVNLNDSTYDDFAILVRANDHADPFVNELSKRGMPFIYVANRGLYKKPIILDIMAYFGLLDNYHESSNLLRVMNMPAFRFLQEDVVNITHYSHKKALSVYQALSSFDIKSSLSEQGKKSAEFLLTAINKHSELSRKLPVTELTLKIINDLKIDANLIDDTLDSQQKRSHLEQFYRKMQNYEADNDDKLLKGFLAYLNAEIDAGETGKLSSDVDAGPEAVKVMTIHTSKGLEFKNVFICNLVEQRFPSRDRKDPIEIPDELVLEYLPEGDAHLMEERRLFYVAITRAKSNLFLCYSDDYGGQTKKRPSRFLIECGLATKTEKSTPTGRVFFEKSQKLPLPLKKAIFKLPEAYDFTQISTFLKCPLEYKYKYLYRLLTPGNPSFSFGQTMHEVFNKILLDTMQRSSVMESVDLFGKKIQKERFPSFDICKKYFYESWVDDWYPDQITKQKSKDAGLAMTENFLNHIKQTNPKPLCLEKPFRVPIGPYVFKGRIDRIDNNEDKTVTIIDYKTGEPRLKLEKVDKQQLLIYQIAAGESLGLNVSELKYLYPKRQGAELKFLGSAKDIDEVKDHIIEVIEQLNQTIAEDRFEELDKRVSHECKYKILAGLNI